MHNISGTGTKIETPHTDPDYAPTVEVFDQLGYDEIYRGVMRLEPEVLTAGKQAWQGAGGAMAQAVADANAEVRAAMADGWRGSAAQLASEAMQAFEALGQHLSDVMSEVGRRLGQANDAAETLRSSLSQPVSASPDLEGALLDPKHAIANSEMQKSAENVRLDVVRVMNSVYAGVFIPTGNNVPGFPVGGMYPSSPQVTAPGSGSTAPGGGSADVVTPGRIPAPGPHTTTAQPDSAHQAVQPAPARPTADRTDGAVPVAPAAVAAPPAPAVPSAPVHAASAQVAPAAADAVVPQADRPAPAAPVAAPAAGPVVAPAVTRPSGTSTKPQSADTKPQSADTKPQSAEGDRKREDKNQQGGDQTASGGDATAGMGGGIVGGLAGGAVAFGGDTTRPSSSIPRPPKRSPDDQDYDEDEYYPDFDEPTFLEPAEPDTELVGHLEPTTPPVVGEWADDEE